jgi:hypothetical protein
MASQSDVEIIIDGKYRMFSDDKSTQECKDGLAKNRYMVVTYCTHNGFFFYFFRGIDEARRYLMEEVCHSSATLADIENDNGCKLFVREQNGQLVESWKGDKINDTPLFRNYTEDKPRTLSQFEKYLLDGHPICLGWSDRAPVTYKLVETSRVQIFEGEEETDDEQDRDVCEFLNV